MALKIWTFLLVMSLPAAEHGRGFGSLAAVLSGIDYHQFQQKHYSDGGRISTVSPTQPHRVDKRAAPKITNKNPYAAATVALHAAAASPAVPSADSRCMARVQSALGEMMSTAGATPGGGNRRHTAASAGGFMDLSGYALHQRLRTAPGAEMYVTGMRAKVMPPGAAAATAAQNDGRPWARVDGCRYDPLGNTLEARMRFGRTLMVSGSVRLLYGGGGGGGGGETGCDMTLRLRPRAGLGFTAAPLTMPEKSPPNRLTAMPTMTIRTTATFIDPEPVDSAAAYVSVHSYNCVGGAAGLPGNREHPVASSDRYEQILQSSEDGGGGGSGGGGSGGGGSGSDELLSGGVDIDLDEGIDFSKFGDRRSAAGQRPSSSEEAQPTAPPPAAGGGQPYVSAGFVAPPAPGPEPRIRRIQYHNVQQRPQHPLLTVATVAANGQHQQSQDQLLMEMEDVFVRGVRSLLAKHMERTLQPVLKDSLMANMGYTVSYG